MLRFSMLLDKSDEKKRADVLLTEKTNFSRSYVQNLIKRKLITINNTIILNTDEKLTRGQNVVVISDDENKKIKFNENMKITPQEIELDIIYEDDDLVVLNKKAGLVCHPSYGHANDTLVNALASRYGKSLSDISGFHRMGIVHRLDMDTSGIMVVAKNNFSHFALSEQFSNSKGEKLRRRYICFVYGSPNPTNGKIETLIGRHPKFRQKNTVLQFGGKKAITMYKTLKTICFSPQKTISEVECELLTGRTHQIRVHMYHMKCPIIGDQVYFFNKSPSPVYPQEISEIKRQALHSSQITFSHPRTKMNMTFEAVLPQDLLSIRKLFT